MNKVNQHWKLPVETKGHFIFLSFLCANISLMDIGFLLFRTFKGETNIRKIKARENFYVTTLI